jgi:NADH-quinone oxidoreductase subunit L
VSGKVIWGLGALGALCTAFYMFRSYYMTFFGREPTEAHVKHVHESPRSMTWVLWFLAAGAVLMSLVGSTLFVPAAITHQHPWMMYFLEPSMALSEAFQRQASVESPTIELGLMALSIVLAASGILLARILYRDMGRTRRRLEVLKLDWRRLHTLIFNKYYVDEIYNATAVRGFLATSRALAWFDLYVVDGMVHAWGWVVRTLSQLGGAIDSIFVDGLVNYIGDAAIWCGSRIRRIQTGRVNAYVMGVAFGVVVLLFIVWVATPVGGQ